MSTSMQDASLKKQTTKRLGRGWHSGRFFYPIMLLLVVLIVSIPALPGLSPVSGAESGTALYIGSRMLEGQLPYRDFWVSQPPLIYFINSIGLAVGGSNGAGIWFFQFAALVVFCGACFYFLSHYFGKFPALMAVAGAMLCLALVPDFANTGEEYALPFQALALLLALQIEEHPRSRWRYFVLGLVIGFLTSLHLTLLGIGVTVMMYLLFARLYRRDWRGLLNLLWIGVGVTLIWAIWAGIFMSAHALPELIDQVFRFDFYAWRVSNLQRLGTFVSALNRLFYGSAFTTFGLLAWLMVLPFLLFKEKSFRTSITSRLSGIILLLAGIGLIFNGLYDDVTHHIFSIYSLSFYRVSFIVVGIVCCSFALFVLSGGFRRHLESWIRRFNPSERSGVLLPLVIAFIDLPVEMALAALPAQDYSLSFLPLLPVLAILAGYLFWSFTPQKWLNANPHTMQLSLFALAAAVLISGVVLTYQSIDLKNVEEIDNLKVYLKANTHPGDNILQWSAYPQIYEITGLTSATRYIDIYPLFIKGYTTPDRIEAFYEEIRTARPRFIVDTGFWKIPLLLPGDQERCSDLTSEKVLVDLQEKSRFRWENPLADRPFVPVEMGVVYRWICENYRVSAQVDGQKNLWSVYELKR